MADTVRYGLISTARIGFSAHVPAANDSLHSEIVAVSSRNLETARAAAREHGIPLAFGSYQEMIESDEIDAVINTLPNSMHHEWTIKAAEAGKHILCEKPLSATMAEAREMKAAAEANNVVLVEAFTPRWTQQSRTVRHLIAIGEIGEVTYLESSLAFRMNRPDDIRLSKPLAGGSLMDVGCYAVYAVRYAMGMEPVSAMAFDRKRSGVEVDTTLSGLLRFPNDAVGHIWCSFDGPRRIVFDAVGTQGTISVNGAFRETAPVTITRGDDEPQIMPMTSSNRFEVQLDEFSECVLTGKEPEFPPDDALRNMAAILALYESAATGKAVDVEHI
ncbi:MAG: Gfo/Idh/MocA family oxidoreductase [Gammaproteobacteria bacterium]|nr:Gfo/Idh/MocA family oxidoreductase [Gammaproteobacteria bacterium]